jgi:hypothetical protein
MGSLTQLGGDIEQISLRVAFEDVIPCVSWKSTYPIQIPWYYISDSANPFRHRVLFAATSDSCGAPVLLGWYGEVLENSVLFVVPA